MNDKAFLDTNIIIYAIDNSSAYRRKQEIARGLIDSHIRKETGVISIQVLQEFIITATNKIKAPLSSEEALEFIRYLSILEIVQPDFDMVVAAVQLQKRHRLSFYDSMIIQAARAAECSLLFSEDLQAGFRLGSLTIQNPFAD
jgi:predicted nucleic acid-binding protein